MTPTEQLLRDALESMLDEYETLHSLYNLGECQATVDARAAIAATSQQAEGDSLAGYKERCQHGVRWENNCRACSAAPLPAQPQGQGAEGERETFAWHIQEDAFVEGEHIHEELMTRSRKQMEQLSRDKKCTITSLYTSPPPAQQEAAGAMGEAIKRALETGQPVKLSEEASRQLHEKWADDWSEKHPRNIRITPEWLRRKIESDPDCDVEAGLGIDASLPSPAPQAAVPSEREACAWIERRYVGDELVHETISREPMPDRVRESISKHFRLEIVPLYAIKDE